MSQMKPKMFSTTVQPPYIADHSLWKLRLTFKHSVWNFRLQRIQRRLEETNFPYLSTSWQISHWKTITSILKFTTFGFFILEIHILFIQAVCTKYINKKSINLIVTYSTQDQLILWHTLTCHICVICIMYVLKLNYGWLKN